MGPHRARHEGLVFERLRYGQDRVADSITRFASSWAGFAAWIALDGGPLGSAPTFDGFPSGLVTMIVSLGAIFLSTFVMTSQNREAARVDVPAGPDVETGQRLVLGTTPIVPSYAA